MIQIEAAAAFGEKVQAAMRKRDLQATCELTAVDGGVLQYLCTVGEYEFYVSNRINTAAAFSDPSLLTGYMEVVDRSLRKLRNGESL